MEVFLLESNENTEVLAIQTAKENQPRLTKRWTTEANLAAAAGERFDNPAGRRNTPYQAKSYSRYFEGKDINFMKQRSEALNEKVKKLTKKEMHLELDNFKPTFSMKIKGNEKCSKIPTVIRTFVIRL